MEKHIANIANDHRYEDDYGPQNKLIYDDDIETAKQIINILVEARTPIYSAVDILNFCKSAIRFSMIDPTWKVKEETGRQVQELPTFPQTPNEIAEQTKETFSRVDWER